MAEETISYSRSGQGWDSFHSFHPDMMIGLNNSLYTWENGELYKHDVNETRNEYYGILYPSTITPIFNQVPLDVKIFKSLGLDSNDTWEAECTTDLSTGVVEPEYYEEKEGDWYAFIRSTPDTVDLKSIATQGIGNVLSFAGLTITFSFDIPGSISNGDKVYIGDGTTVTLIGTMTAHTATTIVVDAAAVTPVAGNFIVVIKDSTAESVGMRGYYMEVKLTNNNTTAVDLFSITSNAQQSKP